MWEKVLWIGGLRKFWIKIVFILIAIRLKWLENLFGRNNENGKKLRAKWKSSNNARDPLNSKLRSNNY